MEKKKEYFEHIKECWIFAQHAAKEITHEENKDQLSNLEFSIFDKCLSPHYYFIQNNEQEPSTQPPTEKQIAYATQLGIQNPEKYSRQQLSEEIDKTKRRKEEMKDD